MSSNFRSEHVSFCQLIIPDECAYDVVKNIGELDCIQFLDRNHNIPAFSRKFTQNIMWCEELERKLRYLEDMLVKENLSPYDASFSAIDVPIISEFNLLENEITGIVEDFVQTNNSLTIIKKSYNEMIELRHVLRKSDSLVIPVDSPQLAGAEKNLAIVNGIIATSLINKFEQFLWRACRGNIFLRYVPVDEEIQDAETGIKVKKCVFAIYLQGEQLVAKVKKICQVFMASVYDVPTTTELKNESSIGLMTRLKNLELVLNNSYDQRRLQFSQICKNYNIWKYKIIKIKSIFAALNMFSYDNGSRTLVAEGWCPTVFIPNIRQALVSVHTESSNLPAILNIINTPKTPPTYYRSNKVLIGFQNMVDAYGVASYGEVNPALFMVVTFPFLFGVMFGDFGHALFLVAVGLYMVLRETQLAKIKSDEIFTMVFGGRYIILFMGIFSLYTGLVYNDFFSKSIFIFPSSWILPSDDTTFNKENLSICAKENSHLFLAPNTYSKKTSYPFGIDPLWMFANNKISFINSIKMKLSVILGYFQMLFGIMFSLVNHRYFGHRRDIVCEFIPQMIFFQSIFGYLVFMIFFKWIFVNDPTKAPSILLTLIDMFVKFGQDIPESDQLYPGQKYIQMLLVVLSIICIPWLLISKPLLIYLERKKCCKANTSNAVSMDPSYNDPLNNPDNGSDQSTPPSNILEDDHETKPISEIAIMQLIHTIEFALGSISHFASYLRLWALSLAHNQLSELLWTMVLRHSLVISRYYGSIVIFFIFYVFIVLSFAILVLMEGLSTFLHALRLHWVEFQSKFYAGAGQPLIVFSLKNMAEDN